MENLKEQLATAEKMLAKWLAVDTSGMKDPRNIEKVIDAVNEWKGVVQKLEKELADLKEEMAEEGWDSDFDDEE